MKSLKDLWQLVVLGKPSVVLMSVALALTVIEIAGTLWFPLLTRDLVDRIAADAPWINAVILLSVVLVVASLVGALGRYLLARVGVGVTAVLQRRLTEKVVHQPMSFFGDHRRFGTTGELVSRVSNDASSIADLMTTQTANFVSGVLLLVGSAIVLWFVDVALTLVLFGLIIAAFLVTLPIIVKLEALGKAQQDRQARMTGVLTQILSEIRLVKAFGTESREISRTGEEIGALEEIGRRSAKITVALEPIMGLAITVALIAILGYGGVRVAQGDLTIGGLTAFILYIFNVVTPLIQISAFMGAYQSAKGATERIREILRQEPEALDTGDPMPDKGGAVAFRDVSFSYPGRDEAVLRYVSLEFRAGQTTALVGTSGSGKSTVLALLERFYQPDSGVITFADIPIETFRLDAWRSRIGYVSQTAPVMFGSLRDNLCYGMASLPSDETILQAVRAAELESFVNDLDDGLDTVIAEVGANVSGGQRQRIALARVFLRSPDLLVLDEATSSLDSETESRVRAALDSVMQGRTNIVVAHRLATVKDADRIYVLDNGEITGYGTHDSLLETHAYYRLLVERQFLKS